MSYPIYKSSNLSSPFLTISDNTLDETSTSLTFIGRRKIDFGNSQQQSQLNLLENFSNISSPIKPISGQCWYDSSNKVMKVFDETINNGSGGWTKIYCIKTGQSVNSIIPNPDEGELFFDKNSKKLKLNIDNNWMEIGPSNELPISVFQYYQITGITTTGVITELFVNGISPNRLIIPINNTWIYEATIVARSSVGYGAWKVEGCIDNNNNIVSQLNNSAITTISLNRLWSVKIDNDNNFKSLKIQVMGEPGISVKWNIVIKVSKIS